MLILPLYSSSGSSTPTLGAISSRSLSGGAIAGIVVGAVVGVAFMILGGVLVVRRSRRVNVAASNTEHPGSGGMVGVEPFTLTGRDFQQPLGSGSSGSDYGMSAGYSRKNGHPGSPPSDSSAEAPTPADINESSITRMIHQVLSRMQVQEAPPAYN